MLENIPHNTESADRMFPQHQKLHPDGEHPSETLHAEINTAAQRMAQAQDSGDSLTFQTEIENFDGVCVDLFSGAGGLSLAAMQAGFRVSAAIELNPQACATYRRNLINPLPEGRRPVLFEGDILDDELKAAITQHVSTVNKKCDLVLGGPPCQGFSVHRINGTGVDDPRNALILRYFELVEALSPKAFLMENVPGILWPRHKSWLEQFNIRGEMAGYHVFAPVIIDARNYGIPQRRRRVFILGVRNDLAQAKIEWPPAQTHGDPSKLIEGLLPWVPAKTVFDQPLCAEDPNNVHMRHSETLVEVFRNTPLDGGSRKDSGRVLPCHTNHNGHKDVYGRIRLSEPGPTMTTACINPSKGRFVHPLKHHGITVRHAARFQTFPDNFIFEGGLIAAGVQIGNAVPVQLGKVLLQHLAKLLEQRCSTVDG